MSLYTSGTFERSRNSSAVAFFDYKCLLADFIDKLASFFFRMCVLTLCIFCLKEKRRKEEEAEVQLDRQLAQEANYAKMAKDLGFQVTE